VAVVHRRSLTPIDTINQSINQSTTHAAVTLLEWQLKLQPPSQLKHNGEDALQLQEEYFPSTPYATT
jgi:hypothetical protein